MVVLFWAEAMGEDDVEFEFDMCVNAGELGGYDGESQVKFEGEFIWLYNVHENRINFV